MMMMDTASLLQHTVNLRSALWCWDAPSQPLRGKTGERTSPENTRFNYSVGRGSALCFCFVSWESCCVPRETALRNDYHMMTSIKTYQPSDTRSQLRWQIHSVTQRSMRVGLMNVGDNKWIVLIVILKLKYLSLFLFIINNTCKNLSTFKTCSSHLDALALAMWSLCTQVYQQQQSLMNGLGRGSTVVVNRGHIQLRQAPRDKTFATQCSTEFVMQLWVVIC